MAAAQPETLSVAHWITRKLIPWEYTRRAVSQRVELLVVTKGHPFDRQAFMAIFDADRGVEATAVDQPAAQIVLRPENAGGYDAVLFYDMSGIALPSGDFVDPPDDYRRSIEALLERGTGIVLLNHALVSWPSWPRWREITGSPFLLRAAEIGGERLPASGFRGGAGEPERNTETKLRVATADHPVVAGLEGGFVIRDELYLKTAGFESTVVPLLRSDFAFEAERFSPPPLAPEAERKHWTHPRGSDLVAWAKTAGRSRVVSCELGDGPDAYANPGFRRLVGNAIRWVAAGPG